MHQQQRRKKLSRQIVAVDLFCGIGALTRGLLDAGIKVKAGYDIEEACRYGYKKNNGVEFYRENIADLTGEMLNRHFPKKSLKVLVGCAPCQPFSTHTNKLKDKTEDDERWNLLDAFGRLVEEVRPDFVSMENVPNLQHQDVFARFIAKLDKLGYEVTPKVVYCPDYGIPQKRKRLVLLASPYAKPCLIERTHFPDTYRSAKSVIEHLPEIEAGEICETDLLHRSPNMNEIMLKRIKASKPNGTWLDWKEELRTDCHKAETGLSYKSVYGRMDWNEPSPTITTQFYNFGTGRFGHTVQNRALSLREGAILQTFPEDYEFVEPEEKIQFTKIGRFIGNAVPVRLGQVIGESIIEHFERQFE